MSTTVKTENKNEAGLSMSATTMDENLMPPMEQVGKNTTGDNDMKTEMKMELIQQPV